MRGRQIDRDLLFGCVDVAGDIKVVAFLGDPLHADALGIAILFRAELIGVDDLGDVLVCELVLSFAFDEVLGGVDELAVAGGLRGAAVEVVRCETNDLLVPATAEIVIEGWVSADDLIEEGPFGEYTGYMGPKAMAYKVDVQCLTHRNQPIYQAFLSQMPPSESSCIRMVGREATLLHHLKRTLGLPVVDVHLPESGAAAAFVVIAIRQDRPGQARQAVLGTLALDPTLGKFTIVVDDDIDIRDTEMVNWALSFRVQPDRDTWIIPDMASVLLDPSQAPADARQGDARRRLSSKIAIDATKKHAYPENSIPPRDHLERVGREWARYWGN